MQWEYVVYIIEGRDPNLITEALDSYGSAGWELVSVVYREVSANMYCFFKRQLLERIS